MWNDYVIGSREKSHTKAMARNKVKTLSQVRFVNLSTHIETVKIDTETPPIAILMEHWMEGANIKHIL